MIKISNLQTPNLNWGLDDLACVNAISAYIIICQHFLSVNEIDVNIKVMYNDTTSYFPSTSIKSN